MHPRKRTRRNATSMKMIGAQVAALRTAAGFTQITLAKALNSSEDTVASIEQGRRPLFLDVAQDIDRLTESKGVLEAAVENMPEVDQIPAWAEEYLDLEQEALALSFYANQVLPGLLQTEAYAQAVFRSRVPALSEDEIATQVAARLERQEILHRKNPPALSFILWEPVVRAVLGGKDVHREQLKHLIDCTNLPGVSIQIMPLSHDTHPALDGPFVLLETDEHQHLAYAETQRGSHLSSDPGEVSILTQRYAMLRTHALNPADSRDLLEGLLGEQ